MISATVAGMTNARVSRTLETQRGTTLAELMVVVVILGILATATVFIITALFNANIQGGRTLNQQTTIQRTSNFAQAHLPIAAPGSIGLQTAGAEINPASIAGDQFVVEADGRCYRVFYVDRENALKVAISNDPDDDCEAIAPRRGPNEKVNGSYTVSDPLHPLYDWVLDQPNDPPAAIEDADPTVFALADKVTRESEGSELVPFAFFSADAYQQALPVDPVAKSNSGAAIYNDATNLSSVAATEISLYFMGQAPGAKPAVGDRLWNQRFDLSSGTSGSGGGGGATLSTGSLSARLATVNALPASSFNAGNGTLTAFNAGALSVDGRAVKANDRILVKSQATAAHNGLYTVLSVGSNAPPDPILDLSPILYWRQTGTDLSDASGNGNGGSYVGNPILGQPGPDATNNAVRLNGSTDWLSTSLSTWNEGGDSTIALRLRRLSANTEDTIINAWDQSGWFQGQMPYLSLQASSGDLVLAAHQGGTTTTWPNVVPNVGDWYDLAIAFDPAGVTVYVDDGNGWVNKGSQPFPSSLVQAGLFWPTGGIGQLQFGKRGVSGTVTAPFHGDMAQIVVFPHALNPINDPLFDEPSGGEKWSLVRASEYASSDQLLAGQLITVSEGTSNGDSLWQLTSDAPLTLNSTPLLYSRKDGLTSTQSEGLVPIGTVLPTAANNAPTGYLMARGQVALKTEYAALFAAIGTTYNVGGEPSNSFRLPDLRGRIPVGNDAGAGRLSSNGNLGNSGGSESHKLNTPQLPAHSHGLSSGWLGVAGGHNHTITTFDGQWRNWSYGASNCMTPPTTCATGYGYNTGAGHGYLFGTTSWAGDHSHSLNGNTTTAGGNADISFKQPFQVLNYMIKY